MTPRLPAALAALSLGFALAAAAGCQTREPAPAAPAAGGIPRPVPADAGQPVGYDSPFDTEPMPGGTR